MGRLWKWHWLWPYASFWHHHSQNAWKGLVWRIWICQDNDVPIRGFCHIGIRIFIDKVCRRSKEKQKADIDSIVKASIDITTVASASIALLLIVFATPLSTFLNAPSLASTFQALGLLIIVRAISTTQYGILAGFGDFKRIAYSNTLSGVVMIVGCILLPIIWESRGH